MADALFDTSVFIDYYRGDTGAQNLIERVLTGGLSASYSSITVFELWLGTMSPEEAATHEDILAFLEEASLDGSTARRAAEMLKSASATEREMLIGDAFIAATAGGRGEPVYTRNTRDFQRLGVGVSTY